MSAEKLSRDAEVLLNHMYQRYLLCRKDGADHMRAVLMGDEETIRARICPEMSTDKTLQLCQELKESGFLRILWASGSVYNTQLTNEAICYMHQQTEVSAVDAQQPEQAVHESHSKQHTQQRTNKSSTEKRNRLSEAWKIAIFTVLGGALASIVTVLLQLLLG